MGRIGLGWAAIGLVCALVLLAGGTEGAAPTRPAPTAAAAPVRIMPLGASSTLGKGSPDTAGYRGPLQERLAERGIAVDMVGSLSDGPSSVPDRDHEGHGGWTIDRMQPHVADWVRDARPDIVLLHVGTNDLIQGASAQEAAQRLAAFLDEIHAVAADAHVVVAGVWAPLPDQRRERAEFAVLGGEVVDRHRAQGHSVAYVDTSTMLPPSHIADGLHPNADGYRRIAAMWEREILAVLRVRP